MISRVWFLQLIKVFFKSQPSRWWGNEPPGVISAVTEINTVVPPDKMAEQVKQETIHQLISLISSPSHSGEELITDIIIFGCDGHRHTVGSSRLVITLTSPRGSLWRLKNFLVMAEALWTILEVKEAYEGGSWGYITITPKKLSLLIGFIHFLDGSSIVFCIGYRLKWRHAKTWT